MKKIYISLLVLLATQLSAFAQSGTIFVSGTVTNMTSGAPLAQYPVDVTIYDSLNGMIGMVAQVMTDTMGVYNAAFVTANGPFAGNGEVSVTDCNGSISTLNFSFTNGGGTFPNMDFGICPSQGSCSAAFATTTTPDSTTLAFNDFSLSGFGTIVSWDWTFGDGSTGSGLNLSHTYPATGTYYACLTITTSNGCSSTFCDSVVVGGGNVNGCAVVLDYTLLPSGAYGFSTIAYGNALPVSYFYDFGDGNTLQTNSPTVPYGYPNGSSWVACVTVVFADGCSASSCIGISTPSYYCQASYLVMPDSNGQYSLLLINTSSGPGLNYFWDFGDGGSSTQAFPRHTFAGPGTYYICLTVGDSLNTCSSTFCDSIIVTNKLGSAFTIQVVPVSQATAIHETLPHFSDIQVYPNPASTVAHLALQLPRSADLTWSLVDLQGKVVRSTSVGKLDAGKHQLDLDLSGLGSGMYFLEMQGSGLARATKKIVVEK